jgi:predicted transcriptional regulator
MNTEVLAFEPDVIYCKLKNHPGPVADIGNDFPNHAAVILAGRRRTSAQSTMIQVLQYLTKHGSEVHAGFTQHHLMNINGLPTQHWTRFRRILEQLVKAGFVEQSLSSAFRLFKITDKGERLVYSGLHLLDAEQ